MFYIFNIALSINDKHYFYFYLHTGAFGNISLYCSQISSILSDETLVEQVKKEGIKREKKSTYNLLQEVFGKGINDWNI